MIFFITEILFFYCEVVVFYRNREFEGLDDLLNFVKVVR